MLLGILSSIGPKLAWIATIVIGVAAVFFGIKRSGAQQQQAVDLAKQAKETEKANEASGSVDGLSDAAVHDKLQQFDRD